MAKALILTHIFFGPHGERIEMAEVVKHSAILLGLRGRFTKSVCKMWVRIRAKAKGLAKRLAQRKFLSTEPIFGSSATGYKDVRTPP